MIGPAPGAGRVDRPGLHPLRDGDRDRPVSTRVLRDPVIRLAARRRPRRRVVSIMRSHAPYRSSWWLEDLRLTLDDGSVVDLVLKDLGRDTPGSEARRIKPRRVINPHREPWMYTVVLEPRRAGAPSCWGSVSDTGEAHHWLFLERVDGVPLVEVGTRAAWEDAAAWLGRFHTSIGEQAPTGPLIRHGTQLHRWWFRRALARARSLCQQGDRSGETLVQGLLDLRDTHAAVAKELAGCPGTLIHGEFYPSNVLVEERWGERCIRPVDWEMAGVGPPLLDLAALTSGEWGPLERAAMVLAYRDAVLRAGGRLAPMDRFLRTLTACRLLLAVQWLGWGRGWDPPPQHRQDWLAEASRCAEELEEG